MSWYYEGKLVETLPEDSRKALAELGKLVKTRRNEITETKNARKEEKAAK